MKFDTTFLLHFQQKENSNWIGSCPAISLRTQNLTRNLAKSKLKELLHSYILTSGFDYINSLAGSGAHVNCPEGIIDFEIDEWRCKIDNEHRICKLNAYIDTNDKEDFINKCFADSKTKEEKFNIIITGKYLGLHHNTGKFLCTQCRKKTKKKINWYHMPWELTEISKFLDIGTQDFIIELHRNNLPVTIMFGGLCPKCFSEIINILKPSLATEFELYSIKFSPEGLILIKDD